MEIINTVKQTFITQLAPRCIVLSMVVTLSLFGGGIGFAEDAATSQSAKDQRAVELDAKISDISIEWRQLKRKLRAAGGQAKINLEADAGEAQVKLSKLLDGRRVLYRVQLEEAKQQLGSSWQKLEVSGSEVAAEVTKELEGLREIWQTKYELLRDSHAQHAQQVRDELAKLEKEAAVAAEELSVEMAEERAEIRVKYERGADNLRATYHEFITAAQQEVERLRAAEAGAKADTKARITEAADRLSQQLNVEYDKLHGYYQETIAKAQDYFDDTEQQVNSAEVEVATKIEAERLAAVKWMSGLYKEMAASYEAYQAELDEQIVTLEQRAAQADAETKAKLIARKSKLEAKRDLVKKELADDYEAAIAALEFEIERLQAKARIATDQRRVKAVEAIEYLEARLEAAKKRLQKR